MERVSGRPLRALPAMRERTAVRRGGGCSEAEAGRAPVQPAHELGLVGGAQRVSRPRARRRGLRIHHYLRQRHALWRLWPPGLGRERARLRTAFGG